MKKSLVMALILVLGLVPGQINEGNSSEIICGYVEDYTEVCLSLWPMELCPVGRSEYVFLWEPPDSYKGRYMMFANPRWEYMESDPYCAARCIVDAEEAYYINSCSDCESQPSCEEWLHVKCNIGGYDLYIDGEYVLTEDGDGDCGVALFSGTYTVKLKKKGCSTVTETVRIECGHSTTLRVTMDCEEDCDNGRDDDGDGRVDCDDSDCRNDSDCDPCKNVNCDNKCDGCDLWAMECDDGDCVKDYIIERDSEECGCGDPCKNVDCPDDCDMCHLWSMKCVNGKCEKDEIIEMNSSKCGCPEDPCNDIGKKSVDNFIVNNIVTTAIGILIRSNMTGLGLGVYASVIKTQGDSARMDIVLMDEYQSAGSKNISITPGQTIEFYLRFVPAPGVQTFAELSVDYQYPSSRDSRTIASWEFRNSYYEGFFIGTGCTEYEVYQNDTTTPISITFIDQGEYYVRAKIQGASDVLQVSVYSEDEDDEGVCMGTILILLLFMIYVFLDITRRWRS